MSQNEREQCFIVRRYGRVEGFCTCYERITWWPCWTNCKSFLSGREANGKSGVRCKCMSKFCIMNASQRSNDSCLAGDFLNMFIMHLKRHSLYVTFFFNVFLFFFVENAQIYYAENAGSTLCAKRISIWREMFAINCDRLCNRSKKKILFSRSRNWHGIYDEKFNRN